MSADLRAAFEALIARNQSRLRRLSRIYARGELADDLYQDMLVQIWRTLDTFAGRAEADTWVYRVAINTALTCRRRAARRPIEIGFDRSALEAAAPAGSDSIREWQILDEFTRALAGMEKAVFVLYLEDLTYREIAEITGLTETHVGVKINRIKKTFIDRYLTR